VNENIRFLTIRNFTFSLLLGGVIGILLLPFFSFPLGNQKDYNKALALTVTPSVIIVAVPPPTNLTATAISSSQIDLSWSPASGAVSYNIYRDGVNVDSSATTSYSDTGLSPSTTYTYTVTAINTYGAESAHSSSASATTLAAPVVEEEVEEGGPPLFPPPPEDISLIINNGDIHTNSLDVSLTLSAKDAFQIAISNSSDFAGEVWEKYQTSKKWRLTEGDGKKTVYAKFRSSEGGVSEVVSDSIILDTIPPVNVSNFEAIAGDEQILLRWENPLDKDFGGVRIMGSTIFYPSSPSEGILLYDGKGTSFTAVGLTNGVKYYYTAFAYDKASNFSSGAIVSATPYKVKPPPLPPPPPPPPLPPEIEELTLEDFDFWQEGKKIPLEEGEKIRGETEEPLTVFIDYEKVPEILKTIMVTLEKEGKHFSFLLRINRKKTKYEAALLPPEPGIYPLTVTVLDYKNQTLKIISGYLEVKEPEKPPSPEAPFYKQAKFWFYLLLGIIIVMIIGYLVWKIRMKKLEKSY